MDILYIRVHLMLIINHIQKQLRHYQNNGLILFAVNMEHCLE